MSFFSTVYLLLALFLLHAESFVLRDQVCPLIYKEDCFKLITAPTNSKFTELTANDICQTEGTDGKLANVYNQHHFAKILKYLSDEDWKNHTEVLAGELQQLELVSRNFMEADAERYPAVKKSSNFLSETDTIIRKTEDDQMKLLLIRGKDSKYGLVLCQYRLK